MEERAGKAREIVNKIYRLNMNVKAIHDEVKVVRFINYSFNTEFDSSLGDLTDQIKEMYVDAAKKKIKQLEEELAEL